MLLESVEFVKRGNSPVQFVGILLVIFG